MECNRALICERILRWSALDVHSECRDAQNRLQFCFCITIGNQASVRPIRLQQIFFSMWFKVKGQVVEHWDIRSANAGNAEL